MKCSVYIAASVDGFIAKEDDSVDWLYTAGKVNADMDRVDMGMAAYMASIDCIIMGRKCMDAIVSMNLTPDRWPYGDTRIIVLSNTVKKPPENLPGKVEMYSGDLRQLISKLESEGYKHAYIDGGTTIQCFLNLKLIDEMTITQIPILLGGGKSLFGKTFKDIKLENVTAVVFPNDFVQIHYKVNYN